MTKKQLALKCIKEIEDFLEEKSREYKQEDLEVSFLNSLIIYDTKNGDPLGGSKMYSGNAMIHLTMLGKHFEKDIRSLKPRKDPEKPKSIPKAFFT